jgi:hypothetical protein
MRAGRPDGLGQRQLQQAELGVGPRRRGLDLQQRLDELARQRLAGDRKILQRAGGCAPYKAVAGTSILPMLSCTVRVGWGVGLRLHRSALRVVEA